MTKRVLFTSFEDCLEITKDFITLDFDREAVISWIGVRIDEAVELERHVR